MKKFYQKIIIVTLIVVVSFASILCCCLTGKAQADILSPNSDQIAKHDKGNGDNCHSSKSQEADSKNSQQCECENVIAILATEGFNLPDFVDFVGRFLGRALSSFDRISRFDRKLAQNHILRTSTQVVKSDPPIYLQDSVLRL